jgi:hypothetical protein
MNEPLVAPPHRSLPAHWQKARASHPSTHRIGLVARKGSDSTLVEATHKDSGPAVTSVAGSDGAVFHVHCGSQAMLWEAVSRNGEYWPTVTSVWSIQ